MPPNDLPCAAQASDNTRHLARHPRTGKAFTVPAPMVRRVVLCSGGIYYQLSRVRRARKINDIVLVRLEQLAPFPHDLVVKVGPAAAYCCVLLPLNPGLHCSAWRRPPT